MRKGEREEDERERERKNYEIFGECISAECGVIDVEFHIHKLT
jgi:hypothetical protein